MPRRRKILALARKEMRDILRDRRTLFMAVVFPVILYPLLIIGLLQATSVQETRSRHERAVVAISGAAEARGLFDRLVAQDTLNLVEFDGDPAEVVSGRAAVGIVIPPDFAGTIASNGTGSVTLLFDSANPASAEALARVRGALEAFSGDLIRSRLAGANLSESFARPVVVTDRDQATPRTKGAFQLGRILAFLLVVFCMMGALYPALDAVAGEKERGTLETLLSIPATRLEILSGKYLAVFAMSVASVLANFLSMSVTMLLVNNLVRTASVGSQVDFRMPPSAYLLLLPALVPLAAFFSAISLGVAAFARSTREGQYYLAPIYAVALPLTAVSLMPGMRLTYVTALVPIMSVSLFLKDGMLGTLTPGPVILALGLGCLYAVLALKWAASVFSREEVLFRSPVGEDAVPVGARGVAKPGHAIFAWIVSAILFFYLGPSVLARLGAQSVLAAFVVYAGFVLAPPVALVAIERLSWRKVFPFGLPTARGGAAALLFIPATILLGIFAKAVQSYILSTPASVTAAMPDMKSLPAALYVTFALLPALFEETVYRGLFYQSFVRRMGVPAAVALSALLFCAAHFNVYSVLPYFVLGVVLAVAVQRTGTLLVPMAAHLANNALTVYLARSGYDIDIRPWMVAISAVVGIALLVAGARLARPRPRA